MSKDDPKKGIISGEGKQVPGIIIGDIPEDQRPIDDFVWFKLSRQWVEKTEDRLLKQADEIITTINWFFGLGTSATIISIILKGFEASPDGYILFGISLVLLLISNSLATISKATTSYKIKDPNNAQEILKSFNTSTRNAKIYIFFSAFTLLLGMGLIAPAFIVSFNKKRDDVSIQGFYHTKKIKDKLFITNVSISGSTTDSILKLRIDTGVTLLRAKNYLVINHPLSHKNFDLYYNFMKPAELRTNFFITLIYHSGSKLIDSRTTLMKELSQ